MYSIDSLNKKFEPEMQFINLSFLEMAITGLLDLPVDFYLFLFCENNLALRLRNVSDFRFCLTSCELSMFFVLQFLKAFSLSFQIKLFLCLKQDNFTFSRRINLFKNTKTSIFSTLKVP